MDFDKLNQILESGTQNDLNDFMTSNSLVIRDGKIVHDDPEKVDELIEFWDKRQQVKKINLNS